MSEARIVKKVKLTESIDNLARSGRPRKLNAAAKTFIKVQMRENDETASHQIQKRLARRGVTVHAYSPKIVQRIRMDPPKYPILPADSRRE